MWVIFCIPKRPTQLRVILLALGVWLGLPSVYVTKFADLLLCTQDGTSSSCSVRVWLAGPYLHLRWGDVFTKSEIAGGWGRDRSGRRDGGVDGSALPDGSSTGGCGCPVGADHVRHVQGAVGGNPAPEGCLMTAAYMTVFVPQPGGAVYEGRRLLAHKPVQHSKYCRDCATSWPCPEAEASALVCPECKQDWPCPDYSDANRSLRRVGR